jgi:putative ABC transport system permease protein
MALALTAVGIYGVFHYWVMTRQRELAIRMALGATRSEILLWTAGRVLRIGIAGIAVGAFGCWAVSRWLSSLVFGISAQDPWMLLTALAVVIAVAALAGSAPVWRAARVDPIILLT